jgi:predicted Zn-dependent protease
MGLFNRLQNESQLAFVICHEIAHYYLHHSEMAIDTYVKRINSNEFQKELRDIKKSEYGKRERLENLTKKFSFDSRRHTRQHEHQADSMAVEFLKNTKFNLRETLTALALLDTIDSDTVNIEYRLVAIFNSTEYPFQKRWLRKEQGLLGGHATLIQESWSDSLKTHPDCNKRIAQLNPLIERYIDKEYQATEAKEFRELQQHFQYEIIEYAYKSENFSEALFHCLAMLPDRDADPYLVTMTGKTLNSIYDSFKAHRLSKVTDLPSPGTAANYNLLCQFIQNLYAENVASLSYYFMLKHRNQMADNKDFQTAFDNISKVIQK